MLTNIQNNNSCKYNKKLYKKNKEWYSIRNAFSKSCHKIVLIEKKYMSNNKDIFFKLVNKIIVFILRTEVLLF